MIEYVVHGKAREPADLDRLRAFLEHHASALAEDFRGTHAAATLPQNIRFENYARRSSRVAGGNLLDECRDVDVRGTGNRARRVKAKKAAGRFNRRLARIHRRRDFRKVLLVLLGAELGSGFAKRHESLIRAESSRKEAILVRFAANVAIFERPRDAE